MSWFHKIADIFTDRQTCVFISWDSVEGPIFRQCIYLCTGISHNCAVTAQPFSYQNMYYSDTSDKLKCCDKSEFFTTCREDWQFLPPKDLGSPVLRFIPKELSLRKHAVFKTIRQDSIERKSIFLDYDCEAATLNSRLVFVSFLILPPHTNFLLHLLDFPCAVALLYLF